MALGLKIRGLTPQSSFIPLSPTPSLSHPFSSAPIQPTQAFLFSSSYKLNLKIRRSTAINLSLRVLLPDFYHSVAVLPLPFRRSAVVKFRCSVKITYANSVPLQP